MAKFEKIKLHTIEDTLGKRENNSKLKKAIFPDNYYSYDIHRHIQTDFYNLKLEKNEKINICCFRIVKSRPNKIINNPFLQYLLYKYPSNGGSFSDLFIFPFTKYKSGDILTISKKMIKTLFNKIYNPLGYIKNKDGVFLFYHIEFLSIMVSKVDKSISYMWGLIDEICNQKKIITMPIHKSVTNLFLRNPKLIYLKDKDKLCIETPTVVYYGAGEDLLNYIATLMVKGSTVKSFGPYYYFSDFKNSIRLGGWTSNYEKMKIRDKTLTDINGKYKQGGFVRFALFLGNHRVVLDREKDPITPYFKIFDTKKKISNDNIKKVKKGKGKWADKYDSIIVSNFKNKNRSGYFFKNTTYVSKKYDSFTSLSIHLIDKKTLKPNFDADYEFYDIL